MFIVMKELATQRLIDVVLIVFFLFFHNKKNIKWAVFILNLNRYTLPFLLLQLHDLNSVSFPSLSSRCQPITIKYIVKQETIPTIPPLFAALSLDKSPASKPTSASPCSLLAFLSLPPPPGLLFSHHSLFLHDYLAEASHNMSDCAAYVQCRRVNKVTRGTVGTTAKSMTFKQHIVDSR